MILAAAVFLYSAGPALSVPGGKQLEFSSSALGNVLFNGSVHAGMGKACEDCHNLDAFPMQKQGVANISIKGIMEGNYCGVCHNGKMAFGVPDNCMKCHRPQ